MPARPCVVCGVLFRGDGSRCPTHRRTNDRTTRGYGVEYQRARAVILATGPACHWCGVERATTVDHEPPLVTFRDPRDWSGVLFPACRKCNIGRR